MPQAQAVKVIQVDDDKDFISLTNLMLQSLGEFEIKRASSLKEALNLFDCFQLDIVLIDTSFRGWKVFMHFI